MKDFGTNNILQIYCSFKEYHTSKPTVTEKMFAWCLTFDAVYIIKDSSFISLGCTIVHIKESMVSISKLWCISIPEDINTIANSEYHDKMLHSVARCETGLSPLVKYIYCNSMAYFFCGSFVLYMSCVCHALTSVHCCLVVTWRERPDLLALFCVVYCDFVTLVSWDRCVTWLYRFLILAVFLTFFHLGVHCLPVYSTFPVHCHRVCWTDV